MATASDDIEFGPAEPMVPRGLAIKMLETIDYLTAHLDEHEGTLIPFRTSDEVFRKVDRATESFRQALDFYEGRKASIGSLPPMTPTTGDLVNLTNPGRPLIAGSNTVRIKATNDDQEKRSK